MKQAYQGVSPNIERVSNAFAMSPSVAGIQSAFAATAHAAFLALHTDDAYWDVCGRKVAADAVLEAKNKVLMSLKREQSFQVIAQDIKYLEATVSLLCVGCGLRCDDVYYYREGVWRLHKRVIATLIKD